jgi:hypothetical protein
MEQRVSLITLGVGDLQRSRDFLDLHGPSPYRPSPAANRRNNRFGAKLSRGAGRAEPVSSMKASDGSA